MEINVELKMKEGVPELRAEDSATRGGGINIGARVGRGTHKARTADRGKCR